MKYVKADEVAPPEGQYFGRIHGTIKATLEYRMKEWKVLHGPFAYIQTYIPKEQVEWIQTGEHDSDALFIKIKDMLQVGIGITMKKQGPAISIKAEPPDTAIGIGVYIDAGRLREEDLLEALQKVYTQTSREIKFKR